MKIYNRHIFPGLLVLMFVAMWSCGPEHAADTSKPIYYNLKGLFEQQIQTLKKAGARVQKKTVLDTDTEEKLISDVNWEKELQPFLQADINKPAYSTSYAVVKDVHHITYQLKKGEKLLVRELSILLDSTDTKPIQVMAKLRSENQLYQSEREIIANFDNGGLHSYSVSGFQKLKTLKQRNFDISATVLP